MHVHRCDISANERLDFEQAIRACGKDPGTFSAELFETVLEDSGATLRRVHVQLKGSCAAAQYEASGESAWTGKFARHLAAGAFG
jgi:hypothetical protein